VGYVELDPSAEEVGWAGRLAFDDSQDEKRAGRRRSIPLQAIR